MAGVDMREYFLSQILQNESDSEFLDIQSSRDIMLKEEKSHIEERELDFVCFYPVSLFLSPTRCVWTQQENYPTDRVTKY